MLSGIFAIPVAIAARQQLDRRQQEVDSASNKTAGRYSVPALLLVTVYNFLALALLLNVVVTAMLSMPTAFQRFRDPDIEGGLPNVWIVYLHQRRLMEM